MLLPLLQRVDTCSKKSSTRTQTSPSPQRNNLSSALSTPEWAWPSTVMETMLPRSPCSTRGVAEPSSSQRSWPPSTWPRSSPSSRESQVPSRRLGWRGEQGTTRLVPGAAGEVAGRWWPTTTAARVRGAPSAGATWPPRSARQSEFGVCERPALLQRTKTLGSGAFLSGDEDFLWTITGRLRGPGSRLRSAGRAAAGCASMPMPAPPPR
mmetsp:Transcript_4854/g.14966  ORF Transcript_4854/g.14966 Transcript_4854/m.14966 type:complete len:209 (-) Transcript_4854:54-680(-)